jgi:UDP-N-acetylmuramate dehydrogenase
MAGVDLSRYNTLGLPSRAETLVRIETEAALRSVLAPVAGIVGGNPITVLGGGSNVVLRGRVPGTVLLMGNRGLKLERLGAGRAHLTAAAGERWHDVVRFALGQGYAGLENLALIPGCAGAAPIQNIGAYGVELADRLVRLRALERTSGVVHEFDRVACAFGYRDSVFKSAWRDRFVILDITLEVSRNYLISIDYPDLNRELRSLGRRRPSAVDVAEAVIRIRRRKLPDPRRVGNAGSFFKNPLVDVAVAAALKEECPDLIAYHAGAARVKLAAAQLIDRCGWRGVRHTAVGVWPRQALVLVNYGGATATALLALADAIRDDVRRRFGVLLELEPAVLGQD